jgi:hypothetical protein
MRMATNARLANRQRLDPPGLTPDNKDYDQPFSEKDNNYDDRTVQAPMAPWSETRVMMADRAHVAFLPDVSYAESDSQKGGVPGGSEADDANDREGHTITSQTVEGNTEVGTAPRSPIKLSYGFADWAATNPYPLPIHGKINLRSNPNSIITKPGIWANEGTPSNTNYEQAAPWAAGVFIG